MNKINSVVEICGNAMASAWLFVSSAMLLWFLGAGIGMGIATHSFVGPRAFPPIAFVAFLVGPFPYGGLVVNWLLLLIPFITGMRTQNPLLRYAALALIFLIALASGFRAGTAVHF